MLLKTMLGLPIALASAAPLAAQTPPASPPLAAAFGAREDVESLSLSPDGTKVAIISPGSGRAAILLIGDLVAGGAPKAILRSSGDPDRLTRCDWATSKRLICRIYMIVKGAQTLEFTRLVAVDADGGNLKVLSARTGAYALGIDQSGGTLIDWGGDDASGQVLVTRTFVPEMTTGRMGAERRDGLGVEFVDTVKLTRRTVEQPKLDAVEYISDGHGVVRVMGLRPKLATGYDGPAIKYYYRTATSRDWKPLSELILSGDERGGFDPYYVDREADVVYGFERADGFRQLYKIALDGSLKRERVFARPDVDVAGIQTLGRHRRVVGASYVTDTRSTEFFDPALIKLRASLGKALPGQPLVTFLDASSDENRLLLFAGSDVDPGTYYVYDKRTKKLEEILSTRPQLARVKLANVQPMTYPAADGTMVPGYLTLPAGAKDAKGLPAIVMPHGGPGARDEWGFDWLSQYFAARGFAVLQPNFRGSAGYGDAWFQKNGFQSWRTAVGDVNDAGSWLVKQGIADPKRLAIFGWSYGGYAALQSPALDGALFKAIVAVAPVTDLAMLREESRDYSNFKLVDAFIGKGPHVRDGSPTQNVGKIKAPVLMFHGDLDRNVGVGESREMAERLKAVGGKVEYVEYKGLDHYLEDAGARAQMLAKADAFLRSSMGMPAD